MIHINSLGKVYKNESRSEIKTDAQIEQERKDYLALKKIREKRKQELEAKREVRDKDRKPLPEKELENLEKQKEETIKQELKSRKEKTNHLARQYNLPEPNNPEALKHDRFHCYVCDMRLHIPDAYKNTPEDVQILLGKDEDVRHLCCFCFGKMENGEIVQTSTGKEADKKIRMLIYNPEAGVEEDVEEMTKDRRLYLQSKLRRYQDTVKMIGSLKHDSLEDERHIEDSFLKQFPTRYDWSGN